jgi:hypothetical protein
MKAPSLFSTCCPLGTSATKGFFSSHFSPRPLSKAQSVNRASLHDPQSLSANFYVGILKVARTRASQSWSFEAIKLSLCQKLWIMKTGFPCIPTDDQVVTPWAHSRAVRAKILLSCRIPSSQPREIIDSRACSRFRLLSHRLLFLPSLLCRSNAL